MNVVFIAKINGNEIQLPCQRQFVDLFVDPCLPKLRQTTQALAREPDGDAAL
jgi:hypothetical protein